MLSNTVATSHILVPKLKLKISYLVALVTFQILNSHIWLVATVLDKADKEHFIVTESPTGTVLF